jgi:undecaprenyl-diphosphatase
MRVWRQSRIRRPFPFILETNPPEERNLVNPFDAGIVHLLNRYAQRSYAFDKFVDLVSNDFLLRGGVMTSALWWAWFRRSENRIRDRQILLSGAFSSLVAVCFTRGFVSSLPFRQRPIDESSLHFRIPLAFSDAGVIHWSSFPSDHAVLYFALATVIFLVSRAAGIVSYLFAFFVVCLPRVYLGLHYPTDILVGAMIGVGCAWLFSLPALREAIGVPLLHWCDKMPASFYGSFYLVTFVLATNVESLRVMLTFLAQVISGRIPHAP